MTAIDLDKLVKTAEDGPPGGTREKSAPVARAARPLAVVRAAARDERGFITVFFAVALPALLGLVGLAIDVGRLYTLDTQLANIADAAALAAASQLDRTDGALQRARDAANGLTNDASFSDDTNLGLTFRFAATLSDLRESPAFTLADASGADAIYVEVTTARRSLTASFIQFVGVQNVPIQLSLIHI